MKTKEPKPVAKRKVLTATERRIVSDLSIPGNRIRLSGYIKESWWVRRMTGPLTCELVKVSMAQMKALIAKGVIRPEFDKHTLVYGLAPEENNNA